MVQSGNDAAVALAEAVAGDEGTFVHLMNREAQRMGMKNTRFANPHGLPSPDNYSTAQDLSILAARDPGLPRVLQDRLGQGASPITRSPSRTATACCGWTRPSTA
jgi:hypothetical protein